MSLRRMQLRDFVIVQSLDLEFAPGFTALTGETGAGKSILVDALQLVLGARAEALVVREGCAKAEISAEFDLPAHAEDWLSESGFDANSADGLLVRRTVDAQGKSRAWINGSAATAAQLRDLGDMLVDIHGQHAWQSLTRQSSVRDLLDAYGQIDSSAVRQAFVAWQQASQTLKAAKANAAQLQTERERLHCQIEEWNKLGPAETEWHELNAEHSKAAHAESLHNAALDAVEQLSSDGQSAQSQLAKAQRALQAQQHIDPALADLAARAGDAQALVEDLAHDLRHYLGKASADPAYFAKLDERLSAWIGVAKRLRVPAADLHSIGLDWQHQLTALDASADIELLQKQEQQTQIALGQVCQNLSKQRVKAAKALSAVVTQHMQSLGMQGGQLVAQVQAKEPDATGADLVDLLVAGHAGSTPRPLAKVASGGELSRIALAIAVCTSQLGQASCLVFDEVDAGVGGSVALTVGHLMKSLGAHRQVLCVTHLAQVASYADQHGVVRKSSAVNPTTKGQPVSSRIDWVAAELRVQEIARMLGGDLSSAATLAHAREMLQPRNASIGLLTNKG